jgi:hypothetical protein
MGLDIGWPLMPYSFCTPSQCSVGKLCLSTCKQFSFYILWTNRPKLHLSSVSLWSEWSEIRWWNKEVIFFISGSLKSLTSLPDCHETEWNLSLHYQTATRQNQISHFTTRLPRDRIKSPTSLPDCHETEWNLSLHCQTATRQNETSHFTTRLPRGRMKSPTSLPDCHETESNLPLHYQTATRQNQISHFTTRLPRDRIKSLTSLPDCHDTIKGV